MISSLWPKLHVSFHPDRSGSSRMLHVETSSTEAVNASAPRQAVDRFAGPELGAVLQDGRRQREVRPSRRRCAARRATSSPMTPVSLQTATSTSPPSGTRGARSSHRHLDAKSPVSTVAVRSTRGSAEPDVINDGTVEVGDEHPLFEMVEVGVVLWAAGGAARRGGDGDAAAIDDQRGAGRSGSGGARGPRWWEPARSWVRACRGRSAAGPVSGVVWTGATAVSSARSTITPITATAASPAPIRAGHHERRGRSCSPAVLRWIGRLLRSGSWLVAHRGVVARLLSARRRASSSPASHTAAPRSVDAPFSSSDARPGRAQAAGCRRPGGPVVWMVPSGRREGEFAVGSEFDDPAVVVDLGVVARAHRAAGCPDRCGRRCATR